ncbi:1,2-phenylacetyl-CoA epoxidase subunit PaaD [Bacillus suaedaesalsae]|uniref:Phenylacetate-CoA oxygenase subunit PaaJ n=1 Tax=Bacillus suaedaesalsae TaxID=2810349 RepID=A0ABS2DP58_9BACI|nr:1,2-phenylacetyl-CoA epoxidase subunit PaaD [Bacillus suaedaesalsae]MBM6619406.1 phenylacetate-CoA oxygenase subunit PaaJ [Bacillus suaedaesalsae]
MIKEQVRTALSFVKDPEIDSINILDLGMLHEIKLTNYEITILLLPTFMGCPALEIIKKNVESAVTKEVGDAFTINVEFIFHPPWTSDRITSKGREQLKKFGIAPPPKQMEKDGGWHVDCPYCGSTYTTLENIFGPTACRSILYCKSCKNPFEAMKPISTLM